MEYRSRPRLLPKRWSLFNSQSNPIPWILGFNGVKMFTSKSGGLGWVGGYCKTHPFSEVEQSTS